MVAVPGSQFRLRRPLSLHSVDGERLRLLVEPRGEGTRELAEVGVADTLALAGPLGSRLSARRGARRAAGRRRHRRGAAAVRRRRAARPRRAGDGRLRLSRRAPGAPGRGFRDRRPLGGDRRRDGRPPRHAPSSWRARWGRGRRRACSPAAPPPCSPRCAPGQPRPASRATRRSKRTWPAAPAPATAASCRPATATCGSASKDRCSRSTSLTPGAEPPAAERRGGVVTAPDRDQHPTWRHARRLRLEHPVLNASGTFDALETARRFGAAVADAVSVRRLRAQDGHARGARRQPAAAPHRDRRRA